jgi:thiol-disulfide isomerase/thioredoxin
MTDYRTLEVGQPAPALLSKTLDGKPLELADYHGKYVLLDFWATWCAPCLAETPHLKDVYDAFGKDDRFAMVGLSLDESTKAPEQYAAKNGLRWAQAFLGRGGTSTATTDFGVQGIPSIWLIGPDGKVLAKDLRGESIKAAVAAALGRK